jgi:hypothetical protein
MKQIDPIDKYPIISLGEAMEILPDEDLTYIATYNPSMISDMCILLTLENQLRKEGKLPQLEEIPQKIWIPENWFVYSWRKIKKWLFSRFTMTERRIR